MLACLRTAAVFGVEACPVHVEVDVSFGFPSFTTPGILDDLNRLAFAYRWSTRAIMLDKTKQFKPALENYQQFLATAAGKYPDEEFQARQRVRIIEKELSKK